MSLQEQDHKLIERKLLQQLSAKKSVIFAERINDVGFEKKLQDQPVLKTKSRSLVLTGRILMITASFALLFLTGCGEMNSSSINQKLYTAYFQPYPNVVAPLNKGNADESPVTTAFQTYELKKYKEAHALLSALQEQNESTVFYRGLCELHLEQPEQSIQTLNQITRQSNYYYPATWYKGLACIKMENADKAKIYLKALSDGAPIPALQKRAAELLNKLK